jgi:hypothetical protein
MPSSRKPWLNKEWLKWWEDFPVANYIPNDEWIDPIEPAEKSQGHGLSITEQWMLFGGR